MRVYLDHNATTPLRDEVLDAMLPWLREHFGNPSSTHAEGARARRAVERAREQVAEATGVAARDVVFTSGATEANNAVLASLRGGLAAAARRVLVVATEHPAVLEPAAALRASGIEVETLPVDPNGELDLPALEAALRGAPALVCAMAANNETGVVHDLDEISRRVAAAGGQLHVDATQALGKEPVALAVAGATTAACTAHKLNGPKGVGALLTPGGALPALLLGGPQERRLRGGTENVAGIVGFGEACARAHAERDARARRARELRDRLWDGLSAKVPGLRRNGRPERVLPNTLNVEFEATAGEALVQALDLEGIAASMGAACHSGSIDPSHVLTAMGRTPEQARGSLRFSVGHANDESQIDFAVERIAALCERVRAEP